MIAEISIGIQPTETYMTGDQYLLILSLVYFHLHASGTFR